MVGDRQSVGASADADQALAVPVEPVARLDPPGFDPSRVWVLFCSTGEWSDRTEWPIGFVRDEGVAQRLTVKAGEEWRAATALYPRVEYPDGDVPWAEVTEGQYEKWDAEYREAQEKRETAIRALLTVHPSAVSDCEYDDPTYFCREVVALPAIAMEARQGRDGETRLDPKGESLTANGGDAQPQSSKDSNHEY